MSALSFHAQDALIVLGGAMLGLVTVGKVTRWVGTIYLLFRTDDGQTRSPSAGAVALTVLGSGLWFCVAAVAILWLIRHESWASASTLGFLIGAVVWGGVSIQLVRRIQRRRRGEEVP